MSDSYERRAAKLAAAALDPNDDLRRQHGPGALLSAANVYAALALAAANRGATRAAVANAEIGRQLLADSRQPDTGEATR